MGMARPGYVKCQRKGFLMDDLRQKRVLVTGASLGIGAAVARGFAAAGAVVAVHYNRSEAAAREVVSAIEAGGGSAVAVRGDLAAADGADAMVDAAAAALGGLDILVNNAGAMVKRVPVADADDAYLDQLMAINVFAVVRACRRAIPLLRSQGHGSIINTSSIAVWTGGGGGSVLYAASKGFVNSLTRGLARELAEFGIRVNAVAPGLTDTPFHDGITGRETLERLTKRVPLGRIGVAEDLVGAFLYLASDTASGYVTGTVLEVSGGVVMH